MPGKSTTPAPKKKTSLPLVLGIVGGMVGIIILFSLANKSAQGDFSSTIKNPALGKYSEANGGGSTDYVAMGNNGGGDPGVKQDSL